MSSAGDQNSFRLVAAIFFSALCTLALLSGRIQPSLSASLSSQREENLKDPRLIAEGAKLFAPSCGNAYCHGTGGIGGGAPRLRGKGLEPAYLFKTISNGISATAMLGFKSELSGEQIWKLVAFITSDAKTSPAANPEAPVADKPASSPPAALSKTDASESSALLGNIEAGKALFFDSAQPKSCHFCHSIRGEGTAIGPDLAALANRSPRDLLLSIVLAREIKDPRYGTVKITLRNGIRIAGVMKEEDGESIRVYDTTELPAVLRTVQKADVAKIETENESVMPGDYAAKYTIKQLLDLIAFLKSSESKSPITLKDLFQQPK